MPTIPMRRIGIASATIALAACTAKEPPRGAGAAADTSRPAASSTAAPALPPATGRVYASNEGANTISVIDLAKDTVVATIPVGNRPRGMALSPDGKTVYVTLGRDNAVGVIDVAQ